MEIRTIGRPKHVPVSLCKRAVRVFGEYLMGKRLADNVSVILEFDRNLDHSQYYALCESVSAETPRAFEISLAPGMKKREMLVAIAHEMVHVKQYARHELGDARGSKIRWKGEIFGDETDYWLCPWERECIGYEHGLYFMFNKMEKANDASTVSTGRLRKKAVAPDRRDRRGSRRRG